MKTLFLHPKIRIFDLREPSSFSTTREGRNENLTDGTRSSCQFDKSKVNSPRKKKRVSEDFREESEESENEITILSDLEVPPIGKRGGTLRTISELFSLESLSPKTRLVLG